MGFMAEETAKGFGMIEVVGTVKHHKSDESPDCICCDGPHVYSYSLEAELGTPEQYLAHAAGTYELLNDIDYAQVVRYAMHQVPEGARLCITIEWLEDKP